MTTFTDIIVVIALVALVTVIALAVRTAVRGDGYGRRPAPRSHHEDLFAAHHPRAL